MKRSTRNPILTRMDIPDRHPALRDVTSVFNPGAVRFGDDILLLLRVQNRGRETFFLKAFSRDGIDFRIDPSPIVFRGIEKIEEPVYHCYDARITRIDDRYYILFAMDMDGRCSLGLSVTDDFETYEFIGIVSGGDVRNGVLFPEKIDGRYLRLDRPNKVRIADGPISGSDIHLSGSDDLIAWRDRGVVASGRFHYWDELIGPGPPPVRTRHGWLLVYHGIALHYQPIYQAGVMLLDLERPERVIARSRYNILEPRELYELIGQVPNVVFPSGMIIESDDAKDGAPDEARVLLYYGAADTVVGLAESTIGELVAACRTG